ncbi:SMI1/KNR4 family protein [Salinithrix halophila]|uniref:SMI1/KNR4 family protein n=1 Tax=Salinithrix halophila TaxID=1485204 RepID=A0ABV8JBX4_9BACL
MRLTERNCPICRRPCGEFYLFDYRDGENPTIVFWFHDWGDKIEYVCDTFTELLDKLYALND